MPWVGAIAFTRIPYLPRSNDSDRTRPFTPAFVEA
jgi:hypothetical protein